jgi:AcrR family transcriptional regulator
VSLDIDGSTPRIETRIRSGLPVQERVSTGYERLRPGPGQSPERVRASQRGRISRAMVELAADAGYECVTVRALSRAAGVSSRSFYSHFRNQEECLAETVDSLGHEVLGRAVRRKADATGWKSRVRASLGSLLGDLSERPEAAQLLLVEAVAAGRPARTRATDLTVDLERLLGHLLAKGPDRATPPHRLVIGIAAGIVRVAMTTTLTGRADELPNLSDALGDWVFDVYRRSAVAGLAGASKRSTREGRREPSPLPAELSTVRAHGDYDRILAAVTRLVAENGFASVSASGIRREAGVSRRTLDAWFGDPTDCFLAAVESLARTAASKAANWADETDGRERRIDRTTLALCAMAARNQVLARLILGGILAPGRDGLLRREELISAAAEQLRTSPTQASSPRSSVLAAEASVAAVWRVACVEVSAERGPRLPEAAPFLAALLSVPTKPTPLPS